LKKVAFIGLGNMGAGMASRLLEAGYDLSVYNRTGSKADSLVSRGARLAASPRAACEAADAVVCMVSDDEASRAVWLGEEGILAAWRGRPTDARLGGHAELLLGEAVGAQAVGVAVGGAGFARFPASLVIECSTLSHGWVLELSGLAIARGLSYIDAPVTGLPDAAARGALTMLVGAGEDDLERARPLMLAFADRILRFGGVGAGTAYKLIINLMGAVQIASAAEGVALAQRAGLDLGLVADAIATSQAASPQVVRNTRRFVLGDHDSNVVFSTALRLKDAEYALRFAGELGMGVPFGEVAAKGLRELSARGRSDANESSIFEVAASREAGGPH
jgi:3-hydroxyisobutyrate dehydrogenase